jgi:hypothetical protein
MAKGSKEIAETQLYTLNIAISDLGFIEYIV